MTRPRTPPHRAEAENAVLGGILMRGQDALAEALEFVSEEDFYQPRGQAVFRGMRILKERGEPIDVITLETQLRRTGELELVGGIEGLARIDKYATAHNIKAHAQLVREVAQQRNLAIAAREVAEAGFGEVDDVTEYIAQAREKLVNIADARTRKGYRHVEEVMRESMTDIVERKKRRDDGDIITGITTGLEDLDALTQGLQPSDLIILAARPSMGKTALALNLVQAATVPQAKHWRLAFESRPVLQPVLFFSLEQPAKQLLERTIAAEAQVSFTDLRSTAAFASESDFRRVIAASGRIVAAPWAIDDQAALSITEITARALKWRSDKRYWNPENWLGKKQPTGLIVVDYMQLARGGKKQYGSREQEISEISRGLKAVAKETGCPVVALSQLNRAVDARADHRPNMSDLRESGAIEQDADVILFVYREERYLAPDAPEDKRAAVAGKAEIIIGKQRNGPLGTAHTQFDGTRQKFNTLSKTDDYY